MEPFQERLFYDSELQNKGVSSEMIIEVVFAFYGQENQ